MADRYTRVSTLQSILGIRRTGKMLAKDFARAFGRLSLLMEQRRNLSFCSSR